MELTIFFSIFKVHKILVYFIQDQDITLVGYSDAGYIFDPHNARF